MSMGLKRMQGLGWVALVFLVAISLYPLSLNVGAMHSELVRVDRNIVQTRKEISYLQAEIRARASLEQLEQWNDLLYGYDAPRAAQYLASERALADLHGDDLGQQAPVMVSAAYGLGVKPMGTIGNGGRMPSAGDTQAQKSQQPQMPQAAEASIDRVKPDTAAKAGADAPSKLANSNLAADVNGLSAAARQERRVAQLESSLLGQSTLRDIQLRAAVESARQ